MPNHDAIIAVTHQQIANASRTTRNSGILIALSKKTVEMSREIVRTSSELRVDHLQRQAAKKSRRGHA